MKYKCFVKQELWNDRIELFLTGWNETNDLASYYTIKNGELVGHKLKEGETIPESLLKTSGRNYQLLQAIVDGLKEAGYVAEVDNAQRIVSEATAKERKEQIDWLRTQIEKQL